MQGFVAGLSLGGLYAFLGVYLSTTYRLLGVVNLGICGIAGFGATITAALQTQHLGVLPACLIGIAVAAAACAFAGALMVRLFPGAPVGTQSAVTIAFLLTTLGGSQVVFGAATRAFPVIIGGRAFAVNGVSISRVAVVCVAAALALTIGVPLLVNHTSAGTRLLAIAERPITSELLGLRTAPVVITVWVLGGTVVTVLLLLVAPSIANDTTSLALLIVPACAVALVGAFRRLGVTLVGGLLLGGVQGSLSLQGHWSQWSNAIPFAVIIALLLWSQRREVWDVAR